MTVFDTKVNEVNNKNLTSVVLSRKQINYTKISEIEGKFISTSDYNKSGSDIIDAKIKQRANITNISKHIWYF